MKIFNKAAAVFTLLCLIVCFASCGGRDSLVGKWQKQENNSGIDTYLTFIKSGAYVLYENGDKVCGTYEINGDTLTMTLTGVSTDITFDIDGDSLTLDYNNSDLTDEYKFYSE